MKRLILITTMLGFMALPVFALPTYTLSSDDIDDMVVTFDTGSNLATSLYVETDGDYANGSTPATLAVSFEAGVKLTSTSLDVGIGLTSPPDTDLSAFDNYALLFANDNDDTWSVNLYMETGGSVIIESDVFDIPRGYMRKITWDISGITRSNVTGIGFVISSDLDGGDYPSAGDAFHLSVSVNPIPAPGAIVLGSIGIGLVGWLRRRRKL